MAVRWADSANKHGISRDDALYAMTHAEASDELDTDSNDTVVVYIGHPHPQTDRYIEVIVAIHPPRGLVIFHVMELSDMYRHLVKTGETT